MLVGEETRWQQKWVTELCLVLEPRAGGEEPGRRCFVPCTGWFGARSQLTALLAHAEQQMHPPHSMCHPQSPGRSCLTAKLTRFPTLTQA